MIHEYRYHDSSISHAKNTPLLPQARSHDMAYHVLVLPLIAQRSFVDHFRAARNLLYRKLTGIEDKWRELGQVLSIPESKLERMETGEKSCLLAVLNEYDEDRHFVDALRSIGEKSLADNLDPAKG